MCGFVGFINKNNKNNYDFNLNLIKKMNSTLQHRGPNSEGLWLDVDVGIALGHRRLSIIDLSENGNQPMVSVNGEYVLVYNGEIYNHKDILQDLKKSFPEINLKGNSDTEILLIALEKWGIENTLSKVVGMFSFALWCKTTRKLYLVRDRLGEKPLYYGWQGTGKDKTFFFGSELKALKSHPSFENKINQSAVKDFLSFSFINAPETIYQNIYKLMPGSILEYNYNSEKLITKNYWSIIEKFFKVSEVPYINDLNTATEELQFILNRSVTEQMQADVPYGSFLSGGIDSSTITALMQANSQEKINTFSIGFKEKNFDESIYSRAIAKYLETNHHELILNSSEVISIIPDISEIYDEPFADSSQIPTVLLSRLTKNTVTVALSGDGADEIFGGYNRYVFMETIWKKINYLPNSLKLFVSFVIKNINFKRIRFLDNYVKDFSNKFQKIGKFILKKNIEELYYNFLTTSQEIDIYSSEENKKYFFYELFEQLKQLKPTEKIMIMDMITYLSNDILTKVDRASMSSSLETRMPYLDHRVIEFSFKLPLEFKIKNNKSKIVLKNLLSQYVPAKLFERPKSGFSMPIGDWLKTDLRNWSSELLDERNFKSYEFLDFAKAQSIWKEHLNGKKNHEKLLWNILIFQSWYRQNH